ncbi:MAG: hypothetical protein ACJAZO_005413 [Myxococcota bacterium]|jgi:hypothetical protein
MRHSIAVLLLISLATPGCTKSRAPVDAPTSDVERPLDIERDTPVVEIEIPGPRGSITVLATNSGLLATACETANDCAISCINDGSCCDQLCGCSNVYNVSFLQTLQAQRAASCSTVQCPIASCMAPTETPVAVCNAGQCAVEMRPLVGVPNRDFKPPTAD